MRPLDEYLGEGDVGLMRVATPLEQATEATARQLGV